MRTRSYAFVCGSLLLVMILSTSITLGLNLPDVPSDSQTNARSSQTSSLGWDWVEKAGGGIDNEIVEDIAMDSYGNAYITGTFGNTVTFGQTSLTSSGHDDIFVAKMNNTGTWLWAVQAGGPGVDGSKSLGLDSSGNVYITGKHQGTAVFGTNSLTAAGNADDLFVAKISSNGVWQWVSGATSHVSGTDDTGNSIAVDSNGDAYVTGSFERDIVFGTTTLTWEADKDLFVAKIDTWGNWNWAVMGGGREGNDEGTTITIGPNGNLFIAGTFTGSPTYPATFGSNSYVSTHGGPSSTTGWATDIMVAKITGQGSWIWIETFGGYSIESPTSIVVDSQNNVYCSGYYYGNFTFNGNESNAGGNSDSFIIKITDHGSSVSPTWIEVFVGSAGSNQINSMILDQNENIIVAGTFTGTTVFDSHHFGFSNGGTDIFVVVITGNGTVLWVLTGGGGVNDSGSGVGEDHEGNFMVIGHFDPNTLILSDLELPTSGAKDSFVAKLSSDYDSDGVPDSRDDDDDDDFILDLLDSCNLSPLRFQSTLGSDHDGDGCEDSSEDLDDDNDGLLDENDDCPIGYSHWIPSSVTDLDMDGCHDASEDLDDDGDGFEDYIDECPKLFGNSTFEYEEGCPDTDGDTRPDVNDPFENDSSEWEDSDRDGVGNNSDAFPYDPTQTLNRDGDQYGDNVFGNLPDACPDEYGTSVLDVYGCLDSDGDGVSDINDRFENNSALWQDTDNDGIDDGNDSFPFNPTQTLDVDGDGFGDNPLGSNADRFVNDETQWSDVDGDTYGDNPDGNMPDAFPLDPTQWTDSDGDGHGDNPGGNMPDAFPSDPTQWLDEDGDGLGDNPNGNNSDPFPFDSDNDGYNNSIDPLPFYPTPGDLDNDGWLDDEDWDPYDITEWADWDGDGIGDNEDIDDDNDNWDDWTEMREGTDSHDPNEHPVDSFEIPITDNIALSAWDLLMLLAGLPLASWLIFGFVTRNGRTDIFEGRMRDAKTRSELEGVATEYERALMLRLIGPHQGIRLERVRAELDDEIEMSEAELTGEDDDLGPVVTTPDQTDYTEEELGMQPSEDSEVIDDGKGYEWVDEGEDKWYRPVDGSSWTKWET